MTKKINEITNPAKELFQGLNGILSQKTVVGDPIPIDDGYLIPFSDVEVGIGAGEKVGGMGCKITPNAILLVRGDSSRLISIKDRDSVVRIMDMVPEVVDRLKLRDFFKNPAVKKKVDAFSESGKTETEKKEK